MHLSEENEIVVGYSLRSGQYNIDVHSVEIEGKRLELKYEDFDMEQGTFIDSGTTFTYAHPRVFEFLLCFL